VGDWDTKKFSVARLASRVGYVFQNPDEQLFCRTIQDEVAFGPVNLGYTSERVQELVKDAIEQANLEGKETTNPYDLSATWRKMIAVAAVIAMDTPIVIFDEPTTGQDAAGVARIAAVISALRQRGKTVITITHDIDFCAENFHRVIAMAHGQVLLDGSMAEVLAQEELLATTFIDPPQITRLAKRLGLPGIAWDCDTFLHAYEAWKK
jgi:energy-coupling factor transport system ATP-binding protein